MSVPSFKNVGSQFLIGKKKYVGMAIASPEAIYLVMTQAQNAALMAGAAMGGLIGGLIAGAIAAVMKKPNEPVQTCTLAELNAETLAHADWPGPKGAKAGATPVLMIPRRTIELIEHPSFSNLLKFKVDDMPMVIEYTLFRGASVRDYLLAAGWPLKWKGALLSSPEAKADPMAEHDGDTAERREPSTEFKVKP